MNDADDQLRRLLAAAAKGCRSTSQDALPLGLETRVLAEWRSLRAMQASPWVAPLFRQVVIWSIGISCLAIISFLQDWTAVSKLDSWQDVGTRIANSEIQKHIP